MTEEHIYEKNFSPMPIADLLDGKHHFVIPSFQRGYRWEEKQVVDLLEDIKQFANDDTHKNDSYFLQPIVVKAIKYDGKDAWEVLDGQQRLTTMLLLLKRMMKRLSEDEREDYEDALYDIVYTNRPQLKFDDPVAEDNIDSFYLANAKQIIDRWFGWQKQNKQNLNNFIGTLLYNQKRQVKIIWYAIDESSADLISINIFNRLNKGKISLTSSELIKALFIMDFDIRSSKDNLSAEQLSMEWNEMEKKFQDDNFWYFISDDNKGLQTRIDLLFDFVTQRDEVQDADYSYREFQKLYDFCRMQERNGTKDLFSCQWSDTILDMEGAWKLVRKTFDRLVAWYEDNLYYHYIGYLVAVGFSPLQIFNQLETEKQKRKEKEPDYEWTIEDTKMALRRQMMERFKADNKFISKDAIDDFEYKSDYVLRVLLLFNVESCRRGHNIRFAFDRFKKGSWDVEHVDSQNDATLQEFSERMNWLKSVTFILQKENTLRSLELAEESQALYNQFELNKKVSIDKYRKYYIKINKYYAREADETEEDVDLSKKKKDFISNLTLLDSSTNREYKDAPFAYKRYCIIKHDREGKRFIPLCTRNLFLKYYTDGDEDVSYLDTMRWNSNDRQKYMEAMHNAVDPIFDSVITANDKEDKQ